MTDMKLCMFCRAVTEPQFSYRGTITNSYGVCMGCDSHACSHHIDYVMSNNTLRFDVHKENDGWENKNGREYFDNTNHVHRDTEEVDDEEPYDKKEAFCRNCQDVRTFKIPFYDGGVVKSCNRCNSYYSKFIQSGCQSHKGVHELALDVQNNIVYQNNLQDIGGMMHAYNATPRLYPGRWSCCGSLCYHDHPGCPLFKTSEDEAVQYRNPDLYIRISKDENYLGCDDCDHDSESGFYATEKVPAHIPVAFRLNNGTETPWRHLATWNVGKPHHYPSGECPESVLNMKQDYWAG